MLKEEGCWNMSDFQYIKSKQKTDYDTIYEQSSEPGGLQLAEFMAEKISFTKYALSLVSCVVILFLTLGGMGAQAESLRMVPSKDGTQISFEIHGEGAPTLVFVHGWSCDARYWRAQVPHFSKTHRVVALDLAGHGHSGTSREHYSMRSFGEDVEAVTKAIGSRRVILVGHSMGGSVIAEAARLMPDRVIGVIGIDTLENIEYPMTREEYKTMAAPLIADFPTGTRQFAGQMMAQDTAPRLREWMLADMSAAPPAIALSAMNSLMSQYITGEIIKIFEELPIPVITVNGDLWPINHEGNRRHMSSFDAIVLKGADHFLMLNRGEEFNRALMKAINMILKKEIAHPKACS
jgi:pimeloyl-ACP methyl ester carboxylesterase